MFVSLSAGLFFMVLLVKEAVRQLRDNAHCCSNAAVSICNCSQRSITLSVSVLSCVVSNRLETTVHGPSPILVCFCPATRSGM